jgi:hypothetical protein
LAQLRAREQHDRQVRAVRAGAGVTRLLDDALALLIVMLWLAWQFRVLLLLAALVVWGLHG